MKFLCCVYVLAYFLSEGQGQASEIHERPPTNGAPREHIRFSNETRSATEARLVRHLLWIYEEYGRVARPLLDSSQQMTVYFGLRLIKIDVSEKDQSLKTSVWVRCRWQDEYLRWNPADYDGLNMTVLPWDRVWTPDITLVNTADTGVNIRHADVMVAHNGLVFWAPHRVFMSACLIDVTNFPFDTHRCDLWFQAMSRYSAQMDLQPYFPSWDLDTYLDSFKESQTWTISDNATQRYVASRAAGVLLKFSRRVSLRFSITISRKVGYTGLLLMVPCVFLGCTTLVIFWLPPDRPDRITLAMSLLASFLVLLLILVETAPPSAASIPVLGIYYACVMVLIMMSPFISGIVVHLSRRGLELRRPLPSCVRKLFLDVLSWPLLLHDRLEEIDRLVKQEKKVYDSKSSPAVNISNNLAAAEESVTALDACVRVSRTPRVQHTGYNFAPSGPNGTTPLAALENLEEHAELHVDTSSPDEPPPVGDMLLTGSISASLESDMNRLIHRRLTEIEAQFRRILYESRDRHSARYTDPIYLQWKLLSQVIDRICFLLYLLIIILSHVFFYPRPS